MFLSTIIPTSKTLSKNTNQIVSKGFKSRHIYFILD